MLGEFCAERLSKPRPGATMANEKQTPPALVWQGADRPRVPPGEYTARCTRFQGPEWVRAFGRWGMRLEFVLDPDEQAVSAFFSLGENPHKPHFGVRSKYYRTWVMANGGPPRRGENMPPEVIADPSLGFTVQVSDCTTDEENRLKQDAFVYSRVDEILNVTRASGHAGMQPSPESLKPQSNEAFKPLSAEAYKQVSPFRRSL